MVESSGGKMEVDETAASLQLTKSDSMQFTEFTQSEMDSLNAAQMKQYESAVKEKEKETG